MPTTKPCRVEELGGFSPIVFCQGHGSVPFGTTSTTSEGEDSSSHEPPFALFDRSLSRSTGEGTKDPTRKCDAGCLRQRRPSPLPRRLHEKVLRPGAGRGSCEFRGYRVLVVSFVQFRGSWTAAAASDNKRPVISFASMPPHTVCKVSNNTRLSNHPQKESPRRRMRAMRHVWSAPGGHPPGPISAH